jgi:hypothetical protein
MNIVALFAAFLGNVTSSLRQWPQEGQLLTKYTAAGTFLPLNGTGLRLEIGNATKDQRNPLSIQDKPWEPRCDNSYPNVVYNPKDPHGAWRVWYGCFMVCYDADKGQGTHRQNAWMYMNSSDGISFTKPSLGRLDLSKLPDPKPDSFKTIGKENNIVLGNSDGMGIYHDLYDTNKSRSFKAFGTGCFGDDALTNCVSGTAVSADGLHFTDATEVSWPAPQRYDDHQNLFFDERENVYVLTTRDYTSGSGRDVGLSRATVTGPGGWGSWEKTTENIEQGTGDHQLYSQVTFQYYDIYLGFVMVFDSKSPSSYGHGTVHCRLSWSKDGHDWNWVDSGGLTGKPLIPLGPMSEDPKTNAFDSHIIFSAAFPIAMEDGQIRLYYMGGNGPHNG